MLNKIKNFEAVQNYMALNTKGKSVAGASLIIVLGLISFVFYSAFGPVSTDVVEDTPSVVTTNQTHQSRPATGVKVNNAKDPALHGALVESEEGRKEKDVDQTGAYVVDGDLKTWSADREKAKTDLNGNIPGSVITEHKPTVDLGNSSEKKIDTVVNDEPEVRYLSLSNEELQAIRADKIAAIKTAYKEFRKAPESDSATLSAAGIWDPSTAPNNGKTQAGDIPGYYGGQDKSSSKTSVVPGFVSGDTMIAFTTGEVNSDTTTTVLAQVGSGPLVGAIVPLKVSRIDGYVVFETINISWNRHVAPFKAIALDPGVVSSNAFSTSTDRHILLRYGMLFFSAFAEGAGELASAAINDVTVNGDTITTQSDAKTKDYVIAGVGKIGEKLGNVAEKVFDTPPTVRVKKNQELALVVIEPAEIPWLPKPFRIHKS
ncbi:DotG/IcmE/VirB10 family protein [Aeromonas dhakensis]|uniref:DotG/IcmE/VirB10 family protein n=1 Tax=Aeromonas dhakensis TaxID=196024 RepID=UPI0039882941